MLAIRPRNFYLFKSFLVQKSKKIWSNFFGEGVRHNLLVWSIHRLTLSFTNPQMLSWSDTDRQTILFASLPSHRGLDETLHSMADRIKSVLLVSTYFLFFLLLLIASVPGSYLAATFNSINNHQQEHRPFIHYTFRLFSSFSNNKKRK